MAEKIEVSWEEVAAAYKAQRNEALDALALQAAYAKSLEAKLEAKDKLIAQQAEGHAAQ